MATFEQARQAVDRMHSAYAKPRLPFTLEPGEPGFLESKVGGTPYLPHGMDWPLDSQGNALILLAQVDCAALTGLPEFPHSGLLQCFIGQTGCYGMDFDDQIVPNGFRVLYHETVDPSVTAEEVESKRPPVPEDADSPLMEDAPARICFGQVEEQGITGMDYAFELLFVQVWNEMFPAEPIEAMWDVMGKLDEDDVEKLLNPENSEDFEGPEVPWHQLGGYPYFTQADPRGEQERYEALDTVLFQLDSDSEQGRDLVLWGDVGVGNFFINRDALKRRDFSCVAYNWDCC